jgi:uroporphyrinogen decarboxylase
MEHGASSLVSAAVSKRERLQATIAGEKADRAPVALWRHFPVDDQTPSSLAAAIAAHQAQYDFDFVKVTPASSFCLKDWGVEDEWQGNPEGTRAWTRRIVRSPQDWLNLPELDPGAGSLGAQLVCLDELRGRLGPDTPFVQTIFSPLAQAKNLAGGERLVEHLHLAPEMVLQGLESITRSTLAFVEKAKERGIAGIFYAIQHASYLFFDAEGYRRFGLVFDTRILEAAQEMWLNVLHLHGEALIFDVCDSLPFQVVNWHDRTAGPDLKEASLRVRGAVCGGLRRQATLMLGTPDGVRAEAVDALRSLDSRGVVLGAGCVVPIMTPMANLAAARAAVDFA